MTENNNNNRVFLVGFLAVVGIALLKRHYRGTFSPALRNLNGYVAVITGGNEGIGKETAYILANKGCTIIMGSRNRLKSEEVVREIRKATRNENVFYFPLDLSSKSSIERFAEFIQNRYARVDILINNAAVMALPERVLNQNGHEMHMAVNHLGHFYLTSLLWTLLKRSSRLRIINVSALAHKMNPQRGI